MDSGSAPGAIVAVLPGVVLQTTFVPSRRQITAIRGFARDGHNSKAGLCKKHIFKYSTVVIKVWVSNESRPYSSTVSHTTDSYKNSGNEKMAYYHASIESDGKKA